MKRCGGRSILKGNRIRLLIIAMYVASPLSLALCPSPAVAQQQRAYDIAAQPLARAVLDYSRQSGVFVLAPMDLVKDKRSQRVKGRYSAEEALERLLSGTGLRAVRGNNGGVALVTAGAAGSAPGRMRFGDHDGESAADIIVTAQWREQALIDVPQSVSVVPGRMLERQQFRSVADFQQLVPGMNVTQLSPGEARIVLRGLNAGSVGSTVTVYLDDIPYGSSGSLSNGGDMAGDFDTFDIARVEVLRGPQGTLYGSNALGGVVKYVTAVPDASRFEARAQAGVEGLAGGGMGWSANAMVNLPIGEGIALRASGFRRRQPGYIDSVGRAATDINSTESYGGRASLLLLPTPSLSIRLSALAQRLDNASPSWFMADPQTLKPFNPATGAADGRRLQFELYPEWNRGDYRIYSGTIDWNAGPFRLTSITSHATQSRPKLMDFSHVSLRAAINALYAPTAPNSVGVVLRNDVHVEKFTQEIRLTSTDSDAFEWVAGGYYSDENTLLFQRVLPFEIASGRLIPPAVTIDGRRFDELILAIIDAGYGELAGYATGTLHLGEHFDITAGGRYSHNRQRSYQSVLQLGIAAERRGRSSQGVFTWSVSPRYEIGEGAAIYARVAKGYRPGGPNAIPATLPPGFPTEFKADTVISYETGIRAETADGRASIDASAFYIDWSDILILTTFTGEVGGTGINGNGGRARSKGVELAATVRPVDGLTLVVNAAYTDARLLDDTVPRAGGPNLTGGRAGDRLPGTPEWKIALSADHQWPVSGDVTAFVGGTVLIASDQPALFNAEHRAALGAQPMLDGYATIDLRAGVNFGRYSLTAYVRNLTDSLGLVSAVGYPISYAADIGGANRNGFIATSIPPRTMGATISASF